jgi:predicted dehydrogenase
VRAIVVGTGFGVRVHVPALQKAGFDVVGLVGRDRDKTARRASRVGVPHSFGTLTEALRLPDIDVVTIASPPATHAPLALEAIAAGCHVLVEKPFTLDAVEARTLQTAADAADVIALVGHEFRFAPDRSAVTRALARGAIGPPRLATFIWHLPVVAALDAPAPDWWFDSTRGGGWLNASASHFADAVRLWFGDTATVSAALPMLSDRDPDRFAEDTVVIRFQSLAGCEGIIEQSAAVWGPEFQVMRIAGPAGNVVVQDGTVTLWSAGGPITLDLDAPAIPVEVSDDPRHRFTHLELGPAVAQARALHRLILGGRLEDEAIRPATFADGVAGMEFLDAVRRSAAAGGAPSRV